jgi:hypothetical protein
VGCEEEFMKEIIMVYENITLPNNLFEIKSTGLSETLIISSGVYKNEVKDNYE